MKTINTYSLQYYLITTLIGGLIALIWLVIIPSDAENGVIFGFSTFRLILFAIKLVLLLAVAIITRKALKDFKWSTTFGMRIETISQSDGNLTTVTVLSLSGFLYGVYFIFTAFTTTDLFIQGYFTRLAPFMLWFTFICGQTLIFFFQGKGILKQYLRSHGIAVLVLLFILTGGLAMHSYLWELHPEDWDTHTMFNRDGKFDLEEQDIFAIFNEGKRLQQGINPYERSLDINANIEWNQIFATYLPVSYTLAWFTQEIGLDDFTQWVELWQVLFLIANLGITYLLFYIPYHRYDNLIFAVVASIFWLFNRWTLHMTMIYHIDFIAIFFMLLSLITWPKRKIISLLAFGISLSVKHIAMFMIPLYVIWIWQSVENKSIKQFLQLNLVLGSIPLIVSAPFLVWNAKGFVKSIFVSATRISESHFGAPAIDTLLGLSGIPAKLPMLLMMALIFLAAWFKKIRHNTAAFLILLIFVDFNSVLFRQYMTWAFPIIPLVICENLLSTHETSETSDQN
ncbi:MAG: hypothetical protein ISR58_03545 [Anaerolineales bacterium]|nr:hypothetical protein [Chloroflexota bacterium]MBL6980247.1 hypothetical protein [Anaerolineales bacterium]